jgi:hypothetical protein
MRKAAGLLFATSLVIPIGLMATPASSATGPTCKAFSATETTTPGLPKLGTATKINVTVKLAGKFTGCTGGGVTGATVAQTYKYNGNCTTFVTGKGGKTTPAVPTSTFTWSNHKTSTATSTVTLITKPGVTPAKLKLATKITKGQFAGTSNSGTVILSSPKGSCVSIPGSKATLTSSGSFSFK